MFIISITESQLAAGFPLRNPWDRDIKRVEERAVMAHPSEKENEINIFMK